MEIQNTEEVKSGGDKKDVTQAPPAPQNPPCKNSCGNARRNGSAYCQECSDKHKNEFQDVDLPPNSEIIDTHDENGEHKQIEVPPPKVEKDLSEFDNLENDGKI